MPQGLKERITLGSVEIFSFLDMILNNCSVFYTTLILIYGVLSSFSLYYIQFKEVKILWGPGAVGRVTQTSDGDYHSKIVLFNKTGRN